MSDETIRYLASYLQDNEDEFVIIEDDFYKTFGGLDYEKLQVTIKQFFETLL